jgi:hypothetical protein
LFDERAKPHPPAAKLLVIVCSMASPRATMPVVSDAGGEMNRAPVVAFTSFDICLLLRFDSVLLIKKHFVSGM